MPMLVVWFADMLAICMSYEYPGLAVSKHSKSGRGVLYDSLEQSYNHFSESYLRFLESLPMTL